MRVPGAAEVIEPELVIHDEQDVQVLAPSHPRARIMQKDNERHARPKAQMITR
jgi:hypothetical protein